MAGSVAPNTVTDGLVLMLDAANSLSYQGSGVIWRDLSTNSNLGTLVNGPTFSSVNGGSIVFDGTDDYVGIENPLPEQTDKPITIEVVFKLSLIKDLSGILGYRMATSDNPIHIEYRTAGFRARLGTANIQGMSGVSLNEIVHICIVSTGTYMEVIKNGSTILGTLSSGTGTILGPKTYFGVGDSSGPIVGQRPLNGNVYFAKIYNRALSSTEVLQNFNAVKTRFGL